MVLPLLSLFSQADLSRIELLAELSSARWERRSTLLMSVCPHYLVLHCTVLSSIFLDPCITLSYSSPGFISCCCVTHTASEGCRTCYQLSAQRYPRPLIPILHHVSSPDFLSHIWAIYFISLLTRSLFHHVSLDLHLKQTEEFQCSFFQCQHPPPAPSLHHTHTLAHILFSSQTHPFSTSIPLSHPYTHSHSHAFASLSLFSLSCSLCYLSLLPCCLLPPSALPSSMYHCLPPLSTTHIQ